MKMKKLLASALAAAMVISSMVGAMVTSAATTVGTITAGTVNAVVGETDTITADINIAFPDGVVAPHNIITVALEGYNLTDIALGTVTYADGSAEGVVSIDADGSNLAAGKVLLEAPVDSKAPTVLAIALTATFVDADDVDTVEGTYAIVVNGADMTNVNEDDIAIDAVNGSLVVAAPHVCEAGTPVDNGDGTHKVPCTGCDKLVVESEAHTYVDGTCACGAVEPVADPVPVDFTLRNPALMVKEKYGFRIRMDFSANGYTDANGKTVKYDHYEIELDTQEYVGSNYTLTPVNKVFTVSEKDESSTSTRDYYFYKNVTAYALNLPINLTVKFYDAQNNYVAYSNTLTFSIAGLTKEKLAASSTAANLKKVYMDMLNYGAATQVYFSQFGTNNPLKTAESIIEGCEDYQKYATQDIPTLGGVSDSKDIAGTGFVITPGLQASSSNNIYYRFTVPTTLDVNNLTVTLTHTDLYGKPVINTYALKDMSKDNKGRYVLAYDQVAIFDSAAVVTAVINDASNPIYSFDYNIDFYVNSKVIVANPDAVYVALAKFSVSSMEYFKTLI